MGRPGNELYVVSYYPGLDWALQRSVAEAEAGLWAPKHKRRPKSHKLPTKPRKAARAELGGSARPAA
jgi:hypothetical protein